MDTGGSFTLQYGGWGVKVTTSLHLMRSEAIPHLIYAFVAFTRAFFFLFSISKFCIKWFNVGGRAMAEEIQ
jgi:hypothetical protein